MGVHVSFANVSDQQDFSLVPIGRYSARLKVDAYQTDSNGQPMTDSNGQPAMFRTGNGDTKWNLTWTILDGPCKDRKILDNLNFSGGGLKRVKVMYVRGGFAEGNEEEIDLEPDDLDNSCWWIEVEHPDPARDNYEPKESKYTFDKKLCRCSTCLKYDGKKINVFARVGFAGMELMKPAEAVKYQAGAATQNGAAGLCGECGAGKHWHKEGQGGCQCDNTDHIPF